LSVDHRRLLVSEGESISVSRKTQEDDSVDDCVIAETWWELTLYIVGMLYLFLSLAVIVDEFFVPALEEMSSDRHMNLTMDVAGATLMAAGGSAPELFTSLFGTFNQTDVGFGTIVGSAVFNVLFVIACVCLLSKEVLKLTWWPLFRDCAYYVVSLIVLAVFVAVVSPGEIYWWEAAVLFAMYFGYVLIMKFNKEIFEMLTHKNYDDMMRESAMPLPSAVMSTTSVKNLHDDIHSVYTVRSFAWPGTFRAGVLKMLREPSNWIDTAGVGIVSKIRGDVNATFKTVDVDNDGYLSKSEMKKLFDELDCPLSDEELTDVIKTLDLDSDGMIDRFEFTNWYVKSEQRIRSRLRDTFKFFDEDNDGIIKKNEVQHVLKRFDSTITSENVDSAIKEMNYDDNVEEITFEEFSKWYNASFLCEKHKDDVEAASKGMWQFLRPPCDDGFFPFLSWAIVLPILLPLYITVPDVKTPGWENWCYFSFFMSIGWVGVTSYFMVEFAEMIGKTLGIPDVIMGLTFLAAGTSVPDLLSSVIVARRGEGDMAVSSSIGSNIFDILIGLPVPWLLFTLWDNGNEFVEIGADGVAFSIVILLVMVVLIIATIHFSGWKLTKRVAFIMFVLYFAFLAQAIILELPFEEVCG